MAGDLEDPRRVEPAPEADERTMLTGWLNYHRMTLFLKCEGLTNTQLDARPVATSTLSLHGLVRHLAEVELYWMSTVFCGIQASYYCDDQHRDGDFEDFTPGEFAEARRVLEAQILASDKIIEGASLDQLSIGRPENVSMRWILTHLIEEYARHNGHADLIRELLDGAVGC